MLKVWIWLIFFTKGNFFINSSFWVGILWNLLMLLTKLTVLIRECLFWEIGIWIAQNTEIFMLHVLYLLCACGIWGNSESDVLVEIWRNLVRVVNQSWIAENSKLLKFCCTTMLYAAIAFIWQHFVQILQLIIATSKQHWF